RTSQPEVYLREFMPNRTDEMGLDSSQRPLATRGGQSSVSRIVYFPWDIDRTFWEVLCVDHGKLLRNAVEWATNEPPPIRVTGPGVLDVTVWRQKHSMTVHLVNLTNPMLMKGPFRELIPVGKQEVRFHLTSRTKVKKVRLLAADKTPRVEREDREWR